MNRKLLATILTASMASSMMSVTILAASDFSDMPDNFATASLEAAVSNGLLSGNNGMILPYEDLTRAQMAAILVRAFGGEEMADLSQFTDVNESAWYYEELAASVHMGIFKGNGNVMNPDASITRQEAFVVLSRAFGLSATDTSVLDTFVDASAVGDWAKADVAAMVNTGFVQGNGVNLYPTQTISRQEFAVVMDRMVETYITQAGTYAQHADGSVMINTPDVTLENVTIAGDLIIGDGVGDGDVTLDNVNIEGTLLVRGGGLNSIIIKGDTNVNHVYVAKTVGNVRLAMETTARVGTVVVPEEKVNVVIEGNVSAVEVASNSSVIVRNGSVEEVAITGENAVVVLEENAQVETLTTSETATNAQITVEEGASVDSANLAASDVTLEVSTGASVSTVEVSGENTNITGSGSVDSVNVSGNNVTVETAGTTVDVADTATGTTAGDETVAPGESTTTGGSTDSSNSGSSSGSSSSKPALSGYDFSELTFRVFVDDMALSALAVAGEAVDYVSSLDLRGQSGEISQGMIQISQDDPDGPSIVFAADEVSKDEFLAGTSYSILQFIGMVSNSETEELSVAELETLVSNYALYTDVLAEKGISVTDNGDCYTVAVTGLLSASSYRGSVSYTVMIVCDKSTFS